MINDRAWASLRPTTLTYVLTVAFVTLFFVFSFAATPRYLSPLGEATYMLYRPATRIAETAMRTTGNPLALFVLPIVVIVESFVIGYFVALAVRLLVRWSQ